MATSKGDIVRENQCVLKTYKESYLELHPEASKAKPPNINCDVHGFGVTAATLLKATVKRNYLSDMGMESLLYFVGKSLDRQLAYYVLSRMNDTDMSIIDNDGRKVFVTAEKINWVLDIPISKKEETRQKIRLKKLPKSGHLYKKFETTRGIKNKTAGVFKETLKNAVLNYDDENEFKEAFLLYAICTVLCPSTYDRVQSKYLPLISLAHDANSYDWCELVFADLKANVGKFKEAFDKNGVVKGLGGAVYVLMIIYLDHLDQQPLKWDVSPRISAWTEDDIRDVKKADKHPKGDFGKIGFLDGVWYGRAHPKQTFDILPGEEHAALNFELHQALAKPARRKRDGPCPNFYLQQAKRRRIEEDNSASSPSVQSSSSDGLQTASLNTPSHISQQDSMQFQSINPNHECDSFYDPQVTSTSNSSLRDSIIPPTSEGFLGDSIVPPTSNHSEAQPLASSKPPLTIFFTRRRLKNLHQNAKPLPAQNSVPDETSRATQIYFR